MTLDEIAGRDVPRETIRQLESFSRHVLDHAQRQNLIAHSTMETFWNRHLLDSLQLLRHIRPGAIVCDVGSGAGLPGIVLAIASSNPVTLIEPRRKRADFLSHIVSELRLANAQVICRKVERVSDKFDCVTARAVARLDALLGMTVHLAHRGTRFVLPKGRTAKSELEEALRNWQAEVEVVASVTDPEAGILILEKVRAKSNP